MKIGIQHISFLRALVQGMSVGEALQQYLDPEANVKTARAFARHLVDELDRASRVQGRPELGGILRRDPRKIKGRAVKPPLTPAAPARKIPTFEEWAATFPVEDWGENELPGLYQDHVDSLGPPDPAPAAPSPAKPGRPRIDVDARKRELIKRQLDAINWLADHVASPALPGDNVAGWMPEKAAAGMHALKIHTLEDLRFWVGLKGQHWYRRIRGMGIKRAKRAEAFWNENSQSLGAWPLKDAQDRPALTGHGAELMLLDRQVIESRFQPLELIRVPPALDGSHGHNRGEPSHNSIHVNTDLQAIGEFLKTKKSPATRRAYLKEVSRFYWWCISERGIAVSDLNASDIAEWHIFLTKIPDHWICEKGTPKGHLDWRPFVGQLEDASKQSAQTITKMLLQWLRDAGYLKFNPCALVASPENKPHRRNVERALSRKEWDRAWAFIKSRDDTARERRQAAIIMLMIGCGLRRAEAAGLVVKQLSYELLETEDDTDADEEELGVWTIEVKGKGNRKRQVILPKPCLDTIKRHWNDRRLPNDVTALLPDTPVISADGINAISVVTLYDDIKQAFGAYSDKLASEDSPLAARFRSLSPHWIRHTHSMHFLASGGEIRELQTQLGHASLNTTAIYTQAKLVKRASAIRKMAERL